MAAVPVVDRMPWLCGEKKFALRVWCKLVCCESVFWQVVGEKSADGLDHGSGLGEDGRPVRAVVWADGVCGGISERIGTLGLDGGVWSAEVIGLWRKDAKDRHVWGARP